jgi:concanavalin A-like lectin/glucanase superfamily protein
VDKAYPSTAYGLSPSHPYAETGYYDPGTKRSFFRMDTDNVNGKHILRATFRILEDKSYGCSSTYNTRTDLYRTGSISSSTSWSNQPSWVTDVDHVYSDFGYGSCPNGYVEFDTTSLVVTAAASGWPNTTVGLRAYNEGSVTGWKGFDPGSPRMVITYNTPPSTPKQTGTIPGTTCATGSSRPYISTTSLPAGSVPSLYAQVYDPDGTLDNHGVQAQFAMNHFNTGTGAWESFASLSTPFIKSSTWQTAQVAMPTLADGQTYSWHVRAYDGTDYSSWAPWCEFTVSNRPPTVLPQVTSTEYPSSLDSEYGGVGQTGTFTFSVTDATNVASYQYALDDAGATVRVPASAGVATVRVTPLHELNNSLFVCPVSPSGVVGTACATYDFMVGPPTSPVASWTLDETSGTTAGGPYPATLAGGASWTASARVGRALHLDGTSGHASTAGPVLDTTRSWSVSAWVRLGSLPTNNRTAVAASGSFGSLFYLGYGHDSNGVDRWRVALQTADTDPYSWVYAYSDDAHAPHSGVWTHLAAEYDPAANAVRLFVDGQQNAQVTAPAMWKASGSVQLGAAQWRDTITDYWNGDIDDVKIYNRVLSNLAFDSAYGDADAEIYHLATRPVRSEGIWAMDEGSGNTAADSSGNVRTATGSGSPGWSDTGAFGPSAVSLNGTSQSFATSVPALRTDTSFSVAAWVRLDGTLLAGALPTHANTAVSQDGTDESPFYLGTRLFSETQADGTTATVVRWSFSMSVIDGTTPSGTAWQHATAAVPLDTSVLDQWVLLVGVFDEPARMTRLYVPGTGDFGSVQLPSYLTGWNANGPMEIGRGKYKAAFTDYFPGDIDQVRVFSGVLSANEAANLFQDVPPAVS